VREPPGETSSSVQIIQSQGLGMQFKFGGTKYHLKLNIGGTDSAQVP
jgi:glycine cleavage system pyridoxal-binding protein P